FARFTASRINKAQIEPCVAVLRRHREHPLEIANRFGITPRLRVAVSKRVQGFAELRGGPQRGFVLPYRRVGPACDFKQSCTRVMEPLDQGHCRYYPGSCGWRKTVRRSRAGRCNA